MSPSLLKCPDGPADYYLPILHIIGIVSIPINALCLYLVWFHTPKDSKFRYCLAYLQIITFIVEIDMSWICPGYYLFPMMGGYNMAITNRIFTGHQNTVFGAFKFCFELPSLLLCFIYRHESTADLQTTYKSSRLITYLVIIICHTFPFVTAICLLNSQLPYDQMYHIIQRDWPNCMNVLNIQGFVIYDHHNNNWTAAVGISAFLYISIFSIYGAYLGFHTIYILHKMRMHLSRQTYKIHKTAMINLVLQCLVPFFFVMIPFNFIFIIVLYDLYQYQVWATNSFFIMASHSMASSFVMIVTNHRFRMLISEKVAKMLPRTSLIENFVPFSIPPLDMSSFHANTMAEGGRQGAQVVDTHKL